MVEDLFFNDSIVGQVVGVVLAASVPKWNCSARRLGAENAPTPFIVSVRVEAVGPVPCATGTPMMSVQRAT